MVQELADRPSIVHPQGSGVGWRIALAGLLFSAIFWLGSTATRAIIGNHLLSPGTIELDPYLAPEAQRELFRLLSLTSLLVMTSYAGTFLSGIVFLWWSPFRLREHGWLMLCAILFFVFVPVEIYTMSLDARMIYEEFFTTSDNLVFRELFLKRVTALNGAPIVAMCCYLTIIGIAVFQPFRRPPADAA
jgi:hypothetical protein